MGQSIMGGSSGSTQSSNQAYPGLSTSLAGNIGNVGAAGGQLASMLGLNGSQGQNQAFQNWQNSTGYQFGLNQGMQSINGNAAAQGLLGSGATGKALETYGQNYANTQYGNYTNLLQSLLNSGNQSAGVLAGAGQQSSGQNSSSPGLFGSQGSVGAGIGQILSK